MRRCCVKGYCRFNFHGNGKKSNPIPFVTTYTHRFSLASLLLCFVFLRCTRVRDTFVGDSLLRGVSGGEKKRVTIGEMLAARSKVVLLDDYTRGLDAAAALDLIKTLRLAATVFGMTVIATQYQASQEVFEQFDNVLVLQEGRSVYFGPCSAAKLYFEAQGIVCPPSRTIPDFLSSLGWSEEGTCMSPSLTSVTLAMS